MFPLRGRNAHGVTSCDEQLQMTLRGGCVCLAFHANGRPVSADLRARSGEVISVYALGLGRTVPAGEPGEPAAVAAAREPSDFPLSRTGAGLHRDLLIEHGGAADVPAGAAVWRGDSFECAADGDDGIGLRGCSALCRAPRVPQSIVPTSRCRTGREPGQASERKALRQRGRRCPDP